MIPSNINLNVPEIKLLFEHLKTVRQGNRERIEDPNCGAEELHRLRGQNILISQLVDAKKPVTGVKAVTYLDERDTQY